MKDIKILEIWATVIGCICGGALLVALFALPTLLVQRTSQLHQREVRDYQVACVNAGKSLVHGDCLPVSKP